jgi:2-polyprenyl-3-methyl-5-hydroxy-6-metoxy-1,4-benzoquinol methylase
MNCRHCKTPLQQEFINLGMSPLCESFIKPHQLNHMEPFYPLHVFVCGNCFLVQLDEFVSPQDIFGDYAYFSSYSDSWLKHAKQYTDVMAEKFNLGTHSQVVEIASNDGYLLQYFVEKNIPAFGIEPAANVAAYAINKGIPTVVKFFGTNTARQIAQEQGKADLLLGNNVLAHVPDINDFVQGMKIMLKPEGVITMEFPHLLTLINENQFDTIYHEHFSYLSLITVQRIFKHFGLKVFDIEQLPTHGGSLRIYACHQENQSFAESARIQILTAEEIQTGFTDLAYYSLFTEKVKETKRKILDFLIEAKRVGKSVAGYGAPGKGNTLLNYCGIRTDFIDYTVDRSPHKQGNYLPGTHIPIYHPDKIKETKPDFIFVLPWNLKNEIMQQLEYIREWNGKFVVPIPEVTIY